MTNKEREKMISKYPYLNMFGYGYYIASRELGIYLDPQQCMKFRHREEAIRWIHENYPEY